MSAKLDRKLVRELTGKQTAELQGVEALNASKKELEEYLPNLRRLDVSQNNIHTMGDLPACSNLRMLNLSGNKIADISPLSTLTNLQVLNLGQNCLAGKLLLEGLNSLAVLIANDNAFTSIKSLGHAAHLNTLVLKNNRISSLGKSLQRCTALAKLSMAHNQLSDLADSLENCSQLAELRLSHNQLASLPESLSKCSRLKIVDAGSNLIEGWKGIQVLRKLPKLRSLTLKGCPISEKADYQNQIQTMLPSLQILDNHKLDGMRQPVSVTHPKAGRVFGAQDQGESEPTTSLSLHSAKENRKSRHKESIASKLPSLDQEEHVSLADQPEKRKKARKPAISEITMDQRPELEEKKKLGIALDTGKTSMLSDVTHHLKDRHPETRDSSFREESRKKKRTRREEEGKRSASDNMGGEDGQENAGLEDKQAQETPQEGNSAIHKGRKKKKKVEIVHGVKNGNQNMPRENTEGIESLLTGKSSQNGHKKKSKLSQKLQSSSLRGVQAANALLVGDMGQDSSLAPGWD